MCTPRHFTETVPFYSMDDNLAKTKAAKKPAKLGMGAAKPTPERFPKSPKVESKSEKVYKIVQVGAVPLLQEKAAPKLVKIYVKDTSSTEKVETPMWTTQALPQKKEIAAARISVPRKVLQRPKTETKSPKKAAKSERRPKSKTTGTFQKRTTIPQKILNKQPKKSKSTRSSEKSPLPPEVGVVPPAVTTAKQPELVSISTKTPKSKGSKRKSTKRDAAMAKKQRKPLKGSVRGKKKKAKKSRRNRKGLRSEKQAETELEGKPKALSQISKLGKTPRTRSVKKHEVKPQKPKMSKTSRRGICRPKRSTKSTMSRSRKSKPRQTMTKTPRRLKKSAKPRPRKLGKASARWVPEVRSADRMPESDESTFAPTATAQKKSESSSEVYVPDKSSIKSAKSPSTASTKKSDAPVQKKILKKQTPKEQARMPAKSPATASIQSSTSAALQKIPAQKEKQEKEVSAAKAVPQPAPAFFEPKHSKETKLTESGPIVAKKKKSEALRKKTLDVTVKSPSAKPEKTSEAESPVRPARAIPVKPSPPLVDARPIPEKGQTSKSSVRPSSRHKEPTPRQRRQYSDPMKSAKAKRSKRCRCCQPRSRTKSKQYPKRGPSKKAWGPKSESYSSGKSAALPAAVSAAMLEPSDEERDADSGPRGQPRGEKSEDALKAPTRAYKSETRPGQPKDGKTYEKERLRKKMRPVFAKSATEKSKQALEKFKNPESDQPPVTYGALAAPKRIPAPKASLAEMCLKQPEKAQLQTIEKVPKKAAKLVYAKKEPSPHSPASGKLAAYPAPTAKASASTVQKEPHKKEKAEPAKVPSQPVPESAYSTLPSRQPLAQKESPVVGFTFGAQLSSQVCEKDYPQPCLSPEQDYPIPQRGQPVAEKTKEVRLALTTQLPQKVVEQDYPESTQPTPDTLEKQPDISEKSAVTTPPSSWLLGFGETLQKCFGGSATEQPAASSQQEQPTVSYQSAVSAPSSSLGGQKSSKWEPREHYPKKLSQERHQRKPDYVQQKQPERLPQKQNYAQPVVMAYDKSAVPVPSPSLTSQKSFKHVPGEQNVEICPEHSDQKQPLVYQETTMSVPSSSATSQNSIRKVPQKHPERLSQAYKQMLPVVYDASTAPMVGSPEDSSKKERSIDSQMTIPTTKMEDVMVQKPPSMAVPPLLENYEGTYGVPAQWTDTASQAARPAEFEGQIPEQQPIRFDESEATLTVPAGEIAPSDQENHRPRIEALTVVKPVREHMADTQKEMPARKQIPVEYFDSTPPPEMPPEFLKLKYKRVPAEFVESHKSEKSKTCTKTHSDKAVRPLGKPSKTDRRKDGRAETYRRTRRSKKAAKASVFKQKKPTREADKKLPPRKVVPEEYFNIEEQEQPTPIHYTGRCKRVPAETVESNLSEGYKATTTKTHHDSKRSILKPESKSKKDHDVQVHYKRMPAELLEEASVEGSNWTRHAPPKVDKIQATKAVSEDYFQITEQQPQPLQRTLPYKQKFKYVAAEVVEINLSEVGQPTGVKYHTEIRRVNTASKPKPRTKSEKQKTPEVRYTYVPANVVEEAEIRERKSIHNKTETKSKLQQTEGERNVRTKAVPEEYFDLQQNPVPQSSYKGRYKQVPVDEVERKTMWSNKVGGWKTHSVNTTVY